MKQPISIESPFAQGSSVRGLLGRVLFAAGVLSSAGCSSPSSSETPAPVTTVPPPVPTTMDATTQPSMPVGTAPPAAAPVVPTVNGALYSFQAADLLFEVDAAVAGRVTTFALGGQNVLTGPGVDPANYGSTFWTSPQNVWGWPPPVEINATPFEPAVEGAFVTMSGPVEPRIGVNIAKQFSVDATRRSVTLDYFIFNRTAAPLQIAPWEISRVAPGGLTFFGTGPGGVGQNALGISEGAGATWFDYNQATPAVDQKLFADGVGWLAHVSGNLLFLKQFVDVPVGGAAPTEDEIEIFANGIQTYVEIEQQGAFVQVAPGASVQWTVTWYLRQLPVGLTPSAGSQALVEFVTTVLAGNG